MTTLDPIKALLDKLTIQSAKELGNGYVVYARGMAYVIDAVRAALSSLPEQAVGFGPGDDSDPALTALKYIAEDGSLPDKTRRDARVAAAEIVRLRSAPSQPATVGEQSLGSCERCGVSGPWLIGSDGMRCGNCNTRHAALRSTP